MKRTRRNFPAEQKVRILRRHLVDRVPVSDLCEEYGLQPTVFYRWQKALFENGPEALERRGRRASGAASEEKISALEAKLRRKDEVLSELMEEHVSLKKKLGEI